MHLKQIRRNLQTPAFKAKENKTNTPSQKSVASREAAVECAIEKITGPLNEKELKDIEKEFYKRYVNRESQRKSMTLTEYGRTTVYCPIMHKFWQSVAEKYNMEYETNYASAGKQEDIFDTFFSEEIK